MDEREIAELKKALEEHETRITELERLAQGAHAPTRKGLSIKEFILSKGPGNDVEKTEAIGYFLETREGLPSFNKRDLEEGFRRAKESVPSNINLCVHHAVKKGHMDVAKQKKDNLTAWYMTSSGEGYVESGFREKR